MTDAVHRAPLLNAKIKPKRPITPRTIHTIVIEPPELALMLNGLLFEAAWLLLADAAIFSMGYFRNAKNAMPTKARAPTTMPATQMISDPVNPMIEVGEIVASECD
jgi:hypothetical protein